MPLHAAFTISHRVLPLVRRDADVLCCHLLGRETSGSGKCSEAVREELPSRLGGAWPREGYAVGAERHCRVPPLKLMLRPVHTRGRCSAGGRCYRI